MRIGTSCIITAACLLGWANQARAATYYVATDGSDGNAGSSAQPWATFAHAFSRMVGGDTLILKDGTYHQSLTGIPSGSASAYTTIQAEHDSSVLIDGTGKASIDIASSQYLQFKGLKSRGNLVDRHSLMIVSSNHVKFLKCAFYDAPCSGNASVVNAGPGDSYLLFEDCYSWGCGRYKFLAYQSDHVIFRRCVARHDYHNPADFGNQCATFAPYDGSYVLYENCISLDSGQNAAQYGNFVGGIWFENNNKVDNTIRVLGSIFLKLDGFGAFNDPKVFGTRQFKDVVVWDSKGGDEFGNVYGGGTPSYSVDHVTMGNLWGSYQDSSHAWGTGFTGFSGFPASITNSVLKGCGSYGLGSGIASDYNDFYGNAVDYGLPGSQGAGPHDRRVDPGFKYITRIENGSPLKGTASDGGDIGATVMLRYGVSGTLWGEPGYDALTSEPLWPFPNEAQIKADMSSWPGPNDGKRGFCADGNGLYGGARTLTSYIWEYLGNPCPAEICNGGGSPSTGTGGTATTPPVTGGQPTGGTATTPPVTGGQPTGGTATTPPTTGGQPTGGTATTDPVTGGEGADDAGGSPTKGGVASTAGGSDANAKPPVSGGDGASLPPGAAAATGQSSGCSVRPGTGHSRPLGHLELAGLAFGALWLSRRRRPRA